MSWISQQAAKAQYWYKTRHLNKTLLAEMEGGYVHDRSLIDICATTIMSSFRVPEIFANDYFQRTPYHGYQDSWPSLFISPPAPSGSALHTDSGATHSWMYMSAGMKEWTVYPANTTVLLSGILGGMQSHPVPQMFPEDDLTVPLA